VDSDGHIFRIHHRAPLLPGLIDASGWT
jgi:hypothetical protein